MYSIRVQILAYFQYRQAHDKTPTLILQSLSAPMVPARYGQTDIPFQQHPDHDTHPSKHRVRLLLREYLLLRTIRYQKVCVDRVLIGGVIHLGEFRLDKLPM